MFGPEVDGVKSVKRRLDGGHPAALTERQRSGEQFNRASIYGRDEFDLVRLHSLSRVLDVGEDGRRAEDVCFSTAKIVQSVPRAELKCTELW